MGKPVQKRTLETRARLLATADEIVTRDGFEALRMEEVAIGAGVAKGTVFAHFRDKDALMDQLIGARIADHLDRIETAPPPEDVAGMIAVLMPLLRFMTCERYVFDVILRLSGAAAVEEIGPIAQTFERQVRVLAVWLAQGPFRKDVAPELLAEGVQAFAIQAMALNYCALNQVVPLETRLQQYLDAWLKPPA